MPSLCCFRHLNDLIFYKKKIMKYLITFCLAFAPVYCHAFEVVQLEKVDIDYKAYQAGGHNPMIQDSGLLNREADKYLGLTVNTTVLSYLFFNSLVHGTSDQPIVGPGAGQFRTIGWHYSLGIYVAEFLTIQYEHHSQHMLDYVGVNHFPVENSLGLTITLFRNSSVEHGRIW